MIVIQNTVVSDEVLGKKFTCHLQKCKGACCVEGTSGAPLESSDIIAIADDLEKIKPYMTPAYRESVEQNGFYERDADGDLVTTCQPTGECNFVVYGPDRITQCAIENAWKAGATQYRKPISCHLYPVRLKPYKQFIGVNYHVWNICKPACSLGKELNMPVYRFVKDALIRRFGQDWYDELEEAALERE